MRKGDQAAALWSFHAGGEARHETQLLNSVVCDDRCLVRCWKSKKEVQCLGDPPQSLLKDWTLALLLKGCWVSKQAKGSQPEGKATTLKTVNSLD